MFLNTDLLATTDTTKNQKPPYDLNDPRNPNCPCHKYQKLAEAEFAKNNQSINNQSNKLSQILKNDINPDVNSKQKKVANHSEKIPSRKKRHLFMKLKFRVVSFNRKWQKIKFEPNHHLCFKWN